MHYSTRLRQKRRINETNQFFYVMFLLRLCAVRCNERDSELCMYVSTKRTHDLNRCAHMLRNGCKSRRSRGEFCEYFVKCAFGMIFFECVCDSFCRHNALLVDVRGVGVHAVVGARCFDI